MGLKLLGGAAVAMSALLLLSTGVSPPVAGQGSASVRILYEIGDGTYYWSSVTITDRFATNASWSATLEGAAIRGLDVRSRWYDCCGIGVSGIVPPGRLTPPAGLAGLFLWNRTASRWDLSNVGISLLVLQDGDAIAWSNAGYDSATYAVRYPTPSPRFPDPVLGFRGGGGNTGAFDTEAPNSNKLLWDADVGVREIASTPAVAYGLVYVPTMNGLFALDDTTGGVRWSNPGVRGFSSPAVFAGSVFVGGRDGRVHRVGALNGTVQWSTALLAQPGFSGITSSPRIVYDRVYIGTFNETGGSGELASLWASNGTVAWRFPTGSIHYSTPAFAGDRLVVGVMGRYNTTTQVTFDPPYGVLALWTNGAQAWFYPTGGPVAASPLIHGTLAIVPCRDRYVYAIDWRTGQRVWRTVVGESVSSAALHGDTLFVGTGSFIEFGHVQALNATTGEYLWSYDTNGVAVQSSLAYADGKVFFSTNGRYGEIVALNATTGREVWSHTPDPPDFILGSPVVSNGTVYAPSDNGHVYAFRQEGSSVAELTANALGPAPYPQGSGAGVVLRAEALRGRLTNARLVVTLPAEVNVYEVRPNESRRDGNRFEWDFPEIPFGAYEEVVVGFRAGSVMAMRLDTSVSAQLTYSDDQGDSYPPLTRTIPFAITGTLGDLRFWIPVGVALGLTVLIIFVVLTRRRRRRAPP